MKRNVLWYTVFGVLGAPALLLDPLTAARSFYVVLTVLEWIFVGLYMSRSNWRATSAGRAVLYNALIIAVLTSSGAVTILNGGDYPGRTWVILTLFWGLTVSVANMIRQLLRSQAEARE